MASIKTWAIVILLFFAAGMIVQGSLSITGEQTLSVADFESTQFALPRYGTAECVTGSGRVFSPWVQVPAQGTAITECPGVECKVQARSDFPQDGFLELLDGIFFNRCQSLTNCKAESSKPQQEVNSQNKNEIFELTDYLQGEILFVQYAELTLLKNFDYEQQGMEVRFEYTPVRLRVRNGLGQVSIKEGDCSLSLISGKVLASDARDTEANNPFKCTGNACEPGGVINWVDFWENTEIFGGGIQNYKGTNYFCASGNRRNEY
jgi:hypothetical protein